MRRSPWPDRDGRQLTPGLVLVLVLVLATAAVVIGLIATPVAGSASQWSAGAAEAGPVAVRAQPESVLPVGSDASRSPARSPGAARVPDRPSTGVAASGASGASAASASASRPERSAGGASRPPSPSPSPTVLPALATDTISLFGFVCDDPGGADRVVYSRNPAMADPASSCRTTSSGELTIVVTDPANLSTRYDRVQTGPDGYANAVVPVGRPFVLAVTGSDGLIARQRVSPVYRLNARPDLREPVSVRVFQIFGGDDGTPAARDSVAAPAGSGTPGATATSQPIVIQGMICVSGSRAGIYDYLSGLDQPELDQAQCRRATVDEMEFLLLDNDDPSQLYDDEATRIDGIAVADAPIDRPFFVTEFGDDPGIETGLPGGSAAITIPRDVATREAVGLTVVRNVAPGALDLPAGTMMVSTVVCPPAAGPGSLTVLGPAPTILIRPEGAPPGTPQPGSGDGCEEAASQYRIAPYGDMASAPIAVGDGAGDGALIVPLPATLTADGTRVFDAYRITETSTGQTAIFDVQEGAYTSLRVVLVDQPATPVPDDATATSPDEATPESGADGPADADDAMGGLPGTPGATDGPGTGANAGTIPAAAPATAAPDETGSGGMSYSPVRLLWAALAALAIGIFFAGAWVLRRPGHRWRR